MSAAFIDDDKRDIAARSFTEDMAPLLALGERFPDASDVFVNGDAIWLARGADKQLISFHDFERLTPGHVRRAANNAARYSDIEFGPHAPLLSVKMPPGLRVTYVRPPAADRWYLDVRFLRSRVVPLDSYGEKIMTPGDVACIRGLLDGATNLADLPTAGERFAAGRKAKPNIVIAGGTGSGKTTLLRSLLDNLPPDERLVIIEDTAELLVPGDNVVSLVTTPDVTLDDLLKITLRLTPDRIIVGEVRDAAAVTLVMAMNTGHEGCLFTVHSDDGAAVERLHDLMRLGIPHARIEEVRRAVDVVVQMVAKGHERRLGSVYHVTKNR